MIVTSFFPGRIRLRANIFKDSEIYEKALDICKTHSELVEVIAAKLKINKTLSSQEVEEIIKNM